MAEKVTISRVTHFTKDKNGNTLKNSKGVPYTRCLIDLVDGRKLSGFGSDETHKWSEGLEVEIEITQSGQYLNFSLPKREKGGGLSTEDRERFYRIEREMTAMREMVLRIYKHLNIEDEKPKVQGTNIDYPTPESEGISVEDVDNY